MMLRLIAIVLILMCMFSLDTPSAQVAIANVPNQPIVQQALSVVRATIVEPEPTIVATSNPISLAGDCGWNVQVALDARNGALRHVVLQPGERFSFNASIGNPDPSIVPWRYCGGVPAGAWCDLAARYAQVFRAMGLVPLFKDHHAGDLGGGPENSVMIWNIGGVAGSEGDRGDLEVVNTFSRPVVFQARDIGGSVVIDGGTL